jgi:hypothetical protein
MKLTGSGGQWLEITRATFPPGAEEHYDTDRLLLVAVQFHAFAGATDTWVPGEAWSAFVRELDELERTRQGKASLEAISPDELLLVFRSLDRAGHMAVEGFVGVRSGSHQMKLTFSSIELDPTDLPRIVRELRALDA